MHLSIIPSISDIKTFETNNQAVLCFNLQFTWRYYDTLIICSMLPLKSVEGSGRSKAKIRISRVLPSNGNKVKLFIIIFFNIYASTDCIFP